MAKEKIFEVAAVVADPAERSRRGTSSAQFNVLSEVLEGIRFELARYRDEATIRKADEQETTQVIGRYEERLGEVQDHLARHAEDVYVNEVVWRVERALKLLDRRLHSGMPISRHGIKKAIGQFTQTLFKQIEDQIEISALPAGIRGHQNPARAFAALLEFTDKLAENIAMQSPYLPSSNGRENSSKANFASELLFESLRPAREILRTRSARGHNRNPPGRSL